MARLHPYGNPWHYPSVQWEIDRLEVRSELGPRRKPYWLPIATGRMIGFAKGRTWRWMARFSMPGGNNHRYKVLGYTDDTPMFNSRYNRLPFEVAAELATEWFSQFDDGLDPRPLQDREVVPLTKLTSEPYSVAHAAIDFLWHLHGQGADWRREQSIFVRHVMPDLGMIELASLESRDVEGWKRDLLIKPRAFPEGVVLNKRSAWFKIADAETVRRRRKTINTYLSILRRSLDHAYLNGHVRTDQPWQSVKGFQNADPRRRELLHDDDIFKLLDAATKPFEKFMRGLLHTGARGVELAEARTGDYSTRSEKLRIRDGKDGTVRAIILGADGARFFAALAGKRPEDERLFGREGGRPWTSSTIKWAFANAKANAGLRADLTIRSFRHTYASRAALGGMPIRFLAQQLGHRNISTTEKYYVQFEENEIDEQIRQCLPTLLDGPH